MHEYKRKRGIWGLRSLKKRAALIWAGEGGEKHLWDVWCSDHYECGKSYTGSEIASAVGMWPCLSQWNLNKWLLELMKGFPSGSVVKNQPAMQEPQETQVRSLGQEEEGMATHSQCSCLESPMDKGVWWATVHRVAKSRTWLKRLSTHAELMEGSRAPLPN